MIILLMILHIIIPLGNLMSMMNPGIWFIDALQAPHIEMSPKQEFQADIILWSGKFWKGGLKGNTWPPNKQD